MSGVWEGGGGEAGCREEGGGGWEGEKKGLLKMKSRERGKDEGVEDE